MNIKHAACFTLLLGLLKLTVFPESSWWFVALPMIMFIVYSGIEVVIVIARDDRYDFEKTERKPWIKKINIFKK